MLGTKSVTNILLSLADVDPIDESRNGPEPWSDVVVSPLVGKVQPFPLQPEPLGRSGIVVAVAHVPGTEGVEIGFTVEVKVARRGDGLALEGPGRGECQPSVEAANPVEFAGCGTLPVGVDGADARLPEDVAAYPCDGEVGANPRIRAIVGHGQAGAAVIGRQQAD